MLSVSAHAAERYPSGQLPDDVTPTHYKLDLTLLPDQENFSGTAEIDIALKQPTAEIWMHGQELKIASVVFTDADGAKIDATFSEIPGSDGVAKLSLARAARGPTARISFVYSAPFNKRLEGVYRAEDAGEFYALSQMEPISARFAFPGFDDPRFKTPYDIALTVREGHAAISNAPEIATERMDGGLKRVRFVLIASSGAQALEILHAENDVDLVITDQAMPEMTGHELVDAIKKQWPNMPIILASGYAELPEGATTTMYRIAKPRTGRTISPASSAMPWPENVPPSGPQAARPNPLPSSNSPCPTRDRRRLFYFSTNAIDNT